MKVEKAIEIAYLAGVRAAANFTGQEICDEDAALLFKTWQAKKAGRAIVPLVSFESFSSKAVEAELDRYHRARTAVIEAER